MQRPRGNVALLERQRDRRRNDRLTLPDIRRVAIIALLRGALDAQVSTPLRLEYDIPGLASNDKTQAHRRREIGTACRNARFWRPFLALVAIGCRQIVQFTTGNLAAL